MWLVACAWALLGGAAWNERMRVCGAAVPDADADMLSEDRVAEREWSAVLPSGKGREAAEVLEREGV